MWALEWTPATNGIINFLILLFELATIVVLVIVVGRMSRHISRMDRELGRLRAQRDEAQAQANAVLEQSLHQAETANGETVPNLRPVAKPRRHLWVVPPMMIFGLLLWRRSSSVRRLHHQSSGPHVCPHGCRLPDVTEEIRHAGDDLV
jgi:hypothetical protein